jgi:phosphotransferase system  glucose/maltose/N-acetylglucosamine-specific IIC component
MLHRAIGVIVGGLVTIVLLMIIDRGGWDAYFVPVLIGAIVAFFWPIVIAWWLVRRHREKQQNEIQAEVQRQINQQGRGPS